MVIVRCGYDPRDSFSAEDFARVIDFNTPETVSILGCATSDISEMILREIGVTVKALQKAEKSQLRTFANPVQPGKGSVIGSDRENGGLPSVAASVFPGNMLLGSCVPGVWVI